MNICACISYFVYSTAQTTQSGPMVNRAQINFAQSIFLENHSVVTRCQISSGVRVWFNDSAALSATITVTGDIRFQICDTHICCRAFGRGTVTYFLTSYVSHDRDLNTHIFRVIYSNMNKRFF